MLKTIARHMSSGQKRIITNYTTLPNGVKMPFLGFGTAFGSWAYPDDELRGDFVTPDDCWAAIPKAVRSGYRRFDTALLYGTQKAMGIGLGMEMAKDTFERKDIFVTTKIFHFPKDIALQSLGNTLDWADDSINLTERTLYDFERCLDELNLGYVDSLLMHWPGCPSTTDADKNNAKRKEVWAAMTKIYESGRARSIGVSNFQQKHLQPLLEDDSLPIKPMMNQIEVHPFYNQRQLVEYCQGEGVTVEAWGPFGGGGSEGLLTHTVLKTIGQKYNKNVGQVILRWLIQQNIPTIPKSSQEKRMVANLEVFENDFMLTEEEMNDIFALNKDQSYVIQSGGIP